ncbi:MAG: hypothetical protein AAB908_00860 [Patescibacteria group bacterium]
MEKKSGMPWKPWIQGAAVGVLATVVLGFWQGGWVTGGKAVEMARKEANVEVVKALLPICVANFKQAADAPTKLVELKKISSTYSRESFVRDNKWAVIGADAKSGVIDACAEALYKL